MEKEIKILSINVSKEKGTLKHSIERCKITKLGIEGDAHSGLWHRQISLLSKESIDLFSMKTKREYSPGEFAENLTVQGMILKDCNVGDKFYNSSIELMVTQIGKSCHGGGCAVFTQTGSCVMPKDGIFTKVIKAGEISCGDIIYYKPATIKVAVITLSNRASSGEYQDISGPTIESMLEQYYQKINRNYSISYQLIPDNAKELSFIVDKYVKESYDFIVTTGGTGIGANDITPDVIKPKLQKEIPGIMEHIRVKYGNNLTSALLSRGVCGIIDKTFIATVPGSVKGAQEYISEITPHLEHIYRMLREIDSH
jgi:molybdenum cofactor synthesis domain-containing protein